MDHTTTAVSFPVFLVLVSSTLTFGEIRDKSIPTLNPHSFRAHHQSFLQSHARGAARQMYGSGAMRQPNVPANHQGMHNPLHRQPQSKILKVPITQFEPEDLFKNQVSVDKTSPEESRSGAIHRHKTGVNNEQTDDDLYPRHRDHGLSIIDDTDIDPEEGMESCGGSCRGGEFLCTRSCTCIPASWRCDGEFDCVSGEDEISCSGIKQQQCNSNTHARCPHTDRCIHKDWICDGADDCGDFSDETHCAGGSFNCSLNEFECSNGLCVPTSWLCDGDNDCWDYSDEVNCTRQTDCSNEYDFRCNDGSCVSLGWRCDGEADCADQSDELECPEQIEQECGPTEIPCDYRRCIRKEFQCDGDDDCGDWSDEDDCLVVGGGSCGERECETGKCISGNWKCDGESDCEGGEDEANCESAFPKNCTSGFYSCRLGNCILKEWVCDGVQDCSLGDDELGCEKICDPMTQFTCPSVNISAVFHSSHCIKKKQVCDGVKDCANGEDERNCLRHKNCSQSYLSCQHMCMATPDGKDACACKPGYTLESNGESCADIDECSFKTDPVCSQTCNNTYGSYRCGCFKGYILRPDGITCKANGAPPTLLFANRIDIRQVSLNNLRYKAILKNLHNAIAIDFHYKNGLIFWTDLSLDVIRRANINGTNVKDITKWGLNAPGGVAVDWIHDLLFWTDSGTRMVEVSSLNGRIRHVLVSYDLEKPRAIAVHPGKGYVFWTDWGPNPKIERCDMDGTHRKTLIDESIQWPNGLSLDYTADKIYWADAKHHVIESCRLDGSERRKVITKGLPHPFALTLFEDAIYWTDWHTKSISTANKATGSGFRTIHSGLLFPMDIHCFHPQRQPNYTSHCGYNNGGCSHLCLPNHDTYTCICPLGLKLTRNNRTCDKTTDHMLFFARKKDLRIRSLQDKTIIYDVVIPLEGIGSALSIEWDSISNTIFWTDIENKIISSSFINGTDQKVVVSYNIESPTGLALDWVTNKLYWLDSVKQRIEVSNFDGTMRSLLVWDNMTTPRDLTLDPTNGNMYWSDWSNPGRIERACMDGTNRALFHETGNNSFPNGLTVDFATSRLYWINSGLKTMEFASLDGKIHQVLMENLQHPFALTIYENLVLWSDSETNFIYSANKMNGEGKKVIRENLSGLTDLKVMEHERVAVYSKCDSNNGGCSHLCLLTSNSQGYVCACPTGIKLKNDMKTCYSTPDTWLMVAHRTELLQIALDLPYTVDVLLPLPRLTKAVAVDIDTETNEIYWSDADESIIQKANEDFAIATVVSDGLQSADGIVIDSIGRKLYWTDDGYNNIQVCSLSDCEMNRKVLIWYHLDSPRAITLSYEMGLLFWTDWGNNPRIEQSSMDGHNRMTLISERLVWPNGLAVYDGQVFWTDAKLGYVEMAHLKDTSRRFILYTKKLSHPYALVVLHDYIYWSDWQTNAIHRAFRNGSNPSVLVKDIRGPMDIKIVQRIQNKKIANVCEPNNGGCTHLCLRNTKGYSCACPTGVELTEDKKTCHIQPSSYLLLATENALVRISMTTPEKWLFTLPTPGIERALAVDYHWDLSTIFYVDFQLNAIRAVNMSSLTEAWEVLNNLSSPASIAVDWIAYNLYWVETGISKILVSRLDGSSKKIIITRFLEPRCIAVYPQKGFLFWTNVGPNPSIERSYLDGSSIKTLHDNFLGVPNSLAIDYQLNKIFWSDALNNRIEVSDINGNHRAVLVAEALHPMGLALAEEHIVWFDFKNKKIQLANAITGADKSSLRGHVARVMGICSVAKDRQMGKNPCAIHNGYCSHLCLFRGMHGYVCSCPDFVDNSCSRDPRQIVPIDEKDMEELLLYDSGINEEVPETANDFPTHFLLFTIIGLIFVCLSVWIYYWIRCRPHRKYEKETSRAVRAFSNPNYAASTSDDNGSQRDIRHKFTWPKLRFVKSQERVFSVDTVSNKSSSAEVMTLINISPSPTPTNSIILEVPSASC